MFRRIEFIQPTRETPDGDVVPAVKRGLMTFCSEEVAEAWIDHLRGPGRSIPSNSRFYFTETGWREVGRVVAAAARHNGQEYRVIAIKETDAQVVWRDRFTGYEVAVQPPSKRHNRRQRG